MSGAPPAADAADDLLLDEGVLEPVPTVEFHGWSVVARHGGTAVLPWRAHARAAGDLPQQPSAAGLAGLAGFRQAVVRIGKGRAATEADIAAAWTALAPDGRLLIAGFNDIGIATWAKRLAARLGAPGTVLANRARGRVVAFSRTSAALIAPAPTTVPLPDGTPLTVAPGVFSGDGLDGGTQALLTVLAEESDASSVADVGCGAGHLGLAAQRRFPAARVWLLDADARAVACAQANLPGGEVRWWDDQDPWPAGEVDLALLNPPCHAGSALDLGIARRLFAVVRARRLLVVANRQLAYEDDLAALGTLEMRLDDGRFKVLEITR